MKTHRLVKTPTMSVRSLADYMAASEVLKRTVVRGSKFRSIARVIQHDDAKLAITEYLSSGLNDPELLCAKAEYIRNKMADSDFDQTVNDHNADYVDRFADVVDALQLPTAEILPAVAYQPVVVNGLHVTFSPALLLRRKTKTNKLRVGAIMYRYAKGKALPPQTGCYQSAAMCGFLSESPLDENVEPERSLCVTIDTFSGLSHPAPTNATSIWNNMKAACATIAERWQNIDPPAGALL